jgi:hypothetical protein
LFNEKDERNQIRNGRERLTSARQAAEALFKPKRLAVPQVVVPVNSFVSGWREPRFLSISVPPTDRQKRVVPPVRSGEQTSSPAITGPDARRIKTWVKYGMTISQVAQLYEVAVGEIERILRKN